MKKTMTALQNEYNELHDRMGYCYNERTIAAINRRLDEIVDQMNALLK